MFVLIFLCRLKRKIACKIRDEHSLVKDLPPPNETVAKMAARHLPLASAKQGIGGHLHVPGSGRLLGTLR